MDNFSLKLDVAKREMTFALGPLSVVLPWSDPVCANAILITEMLGKATSFEKLTAAQINAATRALRGKKSPAHRARSAFESALAKHDAFKETRVNESAGRVTFTRVPIGSVALFAKVIAAVKVPSVK